MSTTCTRRYRAPSESVSSAAISYNNAQEFEALLSTLSPHHTCAHTPESHFQSLISQAMSVPMDVGMPGAMEESEKGK